MATRTLDIDHAPLLNRLYEMLMVNEPDPVRQQVAIELLAVQHALRMGNRSQATFVATHMHKHIQQMIRQFYEERV